MENGNVVRYVRLNPNANRLQLLVDAGKGLEFLHSLGIVHTNLRGTDILINESLQAYLADFELAAITSSLNTLNASTLVPRPRGSIRWMAPETLAPELFDILARSDDGFSTASDVYAFAMVFIEIFTGNIPFQELCIETSVVYKIVKGIRPTRPKKPNLLGFTDQLWELVQMCWQQDRTRRPPISIVLDHLENILYKGCSRPPVVAYNTLLDRTCINGSSSSVTLPPPIEGIGTAATSRGDDSRRSNNSDPVPAFTEKYYDPKENNPIIFTKWLRRFLHAWFPCITL